MSTADARESGNLFSEKLISEQIRKIFLFPLFTASDILRRFLTYIIAETLAGRSNILKEYTIAVNVLHKPVTFRPQQDAIVRIHAGRLRRALHAYYKEDGQQDQLEINVPKGSYIPVFQNRLEPGVFSVPGSSEPLPAATQESVKLAVMPFSTFETDIARRSFADSLGQQLSAELGKFSDFSVISYYTTRQLLAREREIKELAVHFGTQYVVSGNVRFWKRKLRVSVQLTDTYSGSEIWTEQYHRNDPGSGLFELGDEIVGSIAARIGDFNGIITQQTSRGLTKNKSGQALFNMLSAYHDFYTYFNEEAFKIARSRADAAIQKEPLNEIAWAFKGELALLAFLFNDSTHENPLIEGLRSARTALKINPLSQQGHMTLGMAHFFMSHRELSLEALEQALSLNPSATGNMGIVGCLMICLGEYERGLGLIQKAMQLNQSCPAIFNLFIAICHFKQKEYNLAYDRIERMGMPELFISTLLKLSILVQMGRKAEANMLVKTLKNPPMNKSWISREYIGRFLMDSDLVEKLFSGLKAIHIPVLTVA